MHNLSSFMCLTNLLEGYDYGKQDWLVSIKYDGIRAGVMPEPGTSKRGIKSSLYARSLKAIPNNALQSVFNEYHHLLYGFDGEIADDKPYGDDAMARASGIAMSVSGKADNWRFYCFNYFGNGDEEYCARPFRLRMADAEAKHSQLPLWLQKHIVIVAQVPAASIAEAKAFAEKAELEGYEGAVLMTSNAPYLQRRVLPKNPFGIKLKSIASAEAIITSFEPEVYSSGKTVPKELWGQAKEAVGAIHCKAPGYKPFRIGTGFSKAQAEAMWANKADYIGKVLTFDYMKVGSKDRPRQPRFKGMRAEADIAPETMEALKKC